MVPTDNVEFVREFQNSVYGDDGYENVHPVSSSKLDLSGHFVVNDSYSKVEDATQNNGISDNDSYADPNEFRASRSNVSPELLDNPLYQVVEESKEPEYGLLDKEKSGPEGPVESRPRRNKFSTSVEEYSELER